jgi:uncharacterized CHY-type Zn-finger protein
MNFLANICTKIVNKLWLCFTIDKGLPQHGFQPGTTTQTTTETQVAGICEFKTKPFIEK